MNSGNGVSLFGTDCESQSVLQFNILTIYYKNISVEFMFSHSVFLQYCRKVINTNDLITRPSLLYVLQTETHQIH